MHRNSNKCDSFDLWGRIAWHSKVNGNKSAIIYDEGQVSYERLFIYGNALSVKLITQFGRDVAGKYIILYIENSLEAILAELICIKLGAICVPLSTEVDVDYYLNSHIRENAVCIISNKPVASHYSIPQFILNLKEISNSGDKCFREKFIPKFDEDPIFCIMTSGTTGAPKGVLLNYRGVFDHVRAKINIIKMNEKSIICLCLGLSFVASIWQILAILCVGGTLLLINERERRNIYAVLKKVRDNKVSVLEIVPSMLNSYTLLTGYKREKIKLPDLKTLILTGEPLRASLIKEFVKENHFDIINAYGQSECSDDTFHFIIPKGFDAMQFNYIPIGRPVESVKFMIIDEMDKVVTHGKKGELCISGTCLANGYIEGAGIKNELPLLDGKYFKTGDIVSENNNVGLIFHGRKDHQIKINGVRIELEGIECISSCFPGVKDTLAVKVINRGNEFLQLYYVEDEDGCIDLDKFRRYLKVNLPVYMQPERLICTKAIAYNLNGKKVRNKIEGDLNE